MCHLHLLQRVGHGQLQPPAIYTMGIAISTLLSDLGYATRLYLDITLNHII